MAKGILAQLLDLAKAVASAARSTPPPESTADRSADRSADRTPGQRPAAPPRRLSSSSPAERPSERSRLRREPAPHPQPRTRDSAPRTRDSARRDGAEGDETGGARYAPQADGLPDPGEVVWAWVPYEEDASRGKDRPVLVLDVRQDGDVVGLMLTSKDHAGPRTQGERDHDGRRWMDVGTGAWDSQRRPSEVRLDRVLHLPAAAVRREGAALPRDVFERVVAASRAQ